MIDKVILLRTKDYANLGVCHTVLPEKELAQAGFTPRMTFPRIGEESKPIPDWFEHKTLNLDAVVYDPHDSVESLMKVNALAKRMRTEQARQ